jgi:signal transduction histidine kinase
MWRSGRGSTDTGHGQRLWPVVAMLIAVVALPTAGVLWFMNQAMRNEQWAVRQRLTDAYRAQLQSAAASVRSEWSKKLSLIAQSQRREGSPEYFASLVRTGIVDSALLYEAGRLKYPDLAGPPAVAQEPKTPPWLEGRLLEFERNNPKAAAGIYGRIVAQSGSARESAMALMAQARCLNKAGQPQAAIVLLTRTLSASRYRDATDAQGRLIWPNALLSALELMKDPARPEFRETAGLLVERLNDYRAPLMPSSQRRFLMRRLQSLWPGCPQFPTLAAEELAVEFAENNSGQPKSSQKKTYHALWVYQAPDKSAIALFRRDNLLKSMETALAAQYPIPGVRLSVLPPGAPGPRFLTTEIGDPFFSWQLALNLEGPDPFKLASSQRITAYIWIGALMTAGIVLLSLLMAGYLRRQMRLTRMKNDLIATVSHELKTPLASMRLLVDTLRDGHYQDSQLVQEYLQMIAKENARLSSLIEEFLTFSRMERNKAQFDRSVLRTDEVVHAALEAVGDRLKAPGCQLELDLAPELPPIIGDRDALVTVLVNLLDNALKYSGDEKKIRLRGFVSNGNICLEVQDNGIGFPRSAAKKIFDRFYQVDRTLSRRAGGCGLGLSIVKFIVGSHNGSVTAKSQLGKGSTFTIQLPAAEGHSDVK